MSAAFRNLGKLRTGMNLARYSIRKLSLLQNQLSVVNQIIQKTKILTRISDFVNSR